MNIALLGSTGSIGTSTLKVIAKFPDRYKIAALAAGKNVKLLAKQITAFKPGLVCLRDEKRIPELKTLLAGRRLPEIIGGAEGLNAVAACEEADMVVAAISGAAGLVPTLTAVRSGKSIALANKEVLVMAGELFMHEAQRAHCRIIPVDSEHSAIFQLLQGHPERDVRRLLLTASGGPFLQYPHERFEQITPEQALKHPRWKMGYKVTTDSATLMNKGLEVIEAYWLFGFSSEKISVVIHPESIVHSMVEFVDGTVFAQLSQPDMQAPIAYALSCPERLHGVVRPLQFAKLGMLTFQNPDYKKFPALRLAYSALKAGKLMPAVMNAANEIAVEKFHKKELAFSSIPVLIAKVMKKFSNNKAVTLDNILWADQWARDMSEQLIH